MDRNLAVGDALIKAVELEKRGGPPRLVISNDVKDLIARSVPWYGGRRPPPALNQLREDPKDGELFLHYLDQAFVAWPEGGIFHDVFTTHRDRVVENLDKYRGNDHVRSKYEWLANYHNYVCEDFAHRHPISYSEYADEETAYGNYEAQKLLDHLIDFEPTAPLPPPRRVSPQSLLGNREG